MYYMLSWMYVCCVQGAFFSVTFLGLFSGSFLRYFSSLNGDLCAFLHGVGCEIMGALRFCVFYIRIEIVEKCIEVAEKYISLSCNYGIIFLGV